MRVIDAPEEAYEAGGYFDYDENGGYGALFVPGARRHVVAEVRVGW